MNGSIKERVHELYWNYDMNCARTTLACLGELFHIPLEEQTMQSAIGLHGAGGFRAQCGLVEGALMFIGIYFSGKGKSIQETAALCYKFAEAFTEEFGSLACFDLRPGGFQKSDPPHRCEEFSVKSVEFACAFVKRADAD